MKNWFTSKEFKKITGIICILGITLIIQVIGFLQFNQKLYDMSLEHSMQQVDELSVHVEKNFELELERHIQILKVAELQMEIEETLFSDKMINELKKVYDISNFKLMGISDLNGNGVDSTGDTYNISYQNIRKHIENDEVYISNILKNGNETLIFIAVPLKIQEEICGILWGKYALADIVDDIEFTNDEYKYFQIIDDQGNYLLCSNNKFSFNKDSKYGEETIWEELKNCRYTDGMSVQKIYEMVQKRESGNFYFEDAGQGHYVSCRPLGINNWYLFSVQVDEGLHSYVRGTRQIALRFFMILIIGLLTIFGVIYNLIYTLYKKIVKQNREIRTINIMFQETLQQTKSIPFTIDQERKQIVLYGYPAKDAVQYCSFEDMRPENMLKKGIIDEDSLEECQKLYESLILQQKKCDPVILYSRIGGKKEWIRISIIFDAEDSTGQMIGVLEDYSEHKEKELQIENHLDDIKKIEKKSQMDFLTNLYNREAFLQKMQDILDQNNRNQQTGALLIMDLDHFKEVNDYMGHAMGDVVLQKTANTLHSFFSKEDIVGRLGGDEFIIFVQDVGDVHTFEQRIKKLNHLLCKVYHKDEKSVTVSASIGIMLVDADHSAFQSLYEKADRALYRVKQANRNGYQIYSENK